MKTLKDLRELTKDLPDDTPIFTTDIENAGCSCCGGYTVEVPVTSIEMSTTSMRVPYVSPKTGRKSTRTVTKPIVLIT